MQERKRPHSWWLEESPWAQDIQATGECEAPRVETSLEDIEAMVRSCQHRLGWRRLMFVAKSGRNLYLADFLPNNAPLIEHALLISMGRMSPTTSVAQGKRMISLRALEEMVGKETDLPSIKEIGDIAELINLGHLQHEARLYRQSEKTFQRVLKTQERLFGMSSTALAVTLLYMAHPVRNQRRIDDALALVKRAEPIVSKSRDPVLSARHFHNLALDANFRRNYEAATGFAEKAITVLPDRYSGELAEGYYALALAKYWLKDYAAAEKAARETYTLYI
jgi:tetratricopeptide (TPR) repeat protein